MIAVVRPQNPGPLKAPLASPSGSRRRSLRYDRFAVAFSVNRLVRRFRRLRLATPSPLPTDTGRGSTCQESRGRKRIDKKIDDKKIVPSEPGAVPIFLSSIFLSTKTKPVPAGRAPLAKSAVPIAARLRSDLPAIAFPEPQKKRAAPLARPSPPGDGPARPEFAWAKPTPKTIAAASTVR